MDTMRHIPAEQLPGVFDGLLSKAMKGEMPWSDFGMSTDTMKALAAVARAYPKVTTPLIAKAKQRFAEQMTRIGTPKPYY